MKVMFYGSNFIVLEDINFSDKWRLGTEKDLNDKDIALNLANWYFDFHEKGILYEDLDEMYSEVNYINKDSLSDLLIKFPKGKETFHYVLKNLDKLNKLIFECEKTFNYNDFYWTNLLVSKDNNLAMPYDYNLLGSGVRYNDIRNVTSSLSKEVGEVFKSEYDNLYKEKYGNFRVIEEEREIKIDKVTSVLVALIFAFKQDKFPTWAKESEKEVVSGKLLDNFKNLI